MAKKHKPSETESPGSIAGYKAEQAAPPPEVELPEMSGFGIHFDQAAGKYIAVRVTNYGTVEVLSPRGPESKHAATARVMEALRLHVATARRKSA